MSLIDKFLDAIKLNDDYDEDEDFLDDDIDEKEDDFEESKPKHRFFKRLNDDDEEDDELDEEPVKERKPAKHTAPAEPQPRADKEPIKVLKKEKPAKKKPNTVKRKPGSAPMEVNVIKPTSMEDARDIVDTLLDDCTVVLNLEGLDVDIAQRIIDFTCGACYSLDGSIQMISSYIFILTPSNVDISGDYQSILSDAFDVPAMRSQY